jgi:pyruvyl transferase EpsO
MKLDTQCGELKHIIDRQLSPYISGECCLLGLPYYHGNVGDWLIWQGVEEFFKAHNIQCRYRASSDTYNPHKIKPDWTIVCNGGGDFGDIWPEVQDFRRKVISEHLNNKIIILPQTVFYQNEGNLLRDVELFSKHHDLTLCARDNLSYKTLTTYFKNNTVLLVPDMAFYNNSDRLKRYMLPASDNTLFLKRADKELNSAINYAQYISADNVTMLDWPTMSLRKYFVYRVIAKLARMVGAVFSSLLDYYVRHSMKDTIIKNGVKFISAYKEVYVTRLHAAILCCLLNKPFTLFNNSYGKNAQVFETWLSDTEGVKLVNV